MVSVASINLKATSRFILFLDIILFSSNMSFPCANHLVLWLCRAFLQHMPGVSYFLL